MNDIAATIYFMTISLVEAKFSLGHAEFEVLVPYHSISLSPKSISLTFYYLTTAFLPFHLLATSSFTLSRSLMLYFPFHLLYHAHCFSPQDQARCFGHHFSHSYLQSSYFNSLLGQFWSSLHIHIHTQTKNKNQSVNQSNKQTKKPNAISTLLSRSNMLFFFFQQYWREAQNHDDQCHYILIITNSTESSMLPKIFLLLVNNFSYSFQLYFKSSLFPHKTSMSSSNTNLNLLFTKYTLRSCYITGYVNIRVTLMNKV